MGQFGQLHCPVQLGLPFLPQEGAQGLEQVGGALVAPLVLLPQPHPHLDQLGVQGGEGGQGIFAPGKAVTRQEMATMIYRYWLLQNEAGPVNSEGLSGYRDGDQVAGWAEEAMIWAVENQIMQGVAAGTLSPGNTATRAQVAQVLVNYQNMG